MANAFEFVDRDEYEQAEVKRTPAPQPGFRPGEIYVNTVEVSTLDSDTETQIDVGYISHKRELCVGVYTFELFEFLILMDALKQGMDHILDDHEAARRLMHHVERLA